MYSNLTFIKHETDILTSSHHDSSLYPFVVNLDNEDEYHFIEFKTILWLFK